ncbi:MAG: hypothetical protein WBK74_05550 [Limnochordia bacterium]|jgi:hypothetical protein|nr:hypothetical protein [Limnochordia bacterium]
MRIVFIGRKFCLVALVLLLVMAAGCKPSLLPGSGSDTPGSGSGPTGDESKYWHFKVIVQDWSEQPVAGALVELYFGDQLQYSGHTDESGEVEFNNIDVTGRTGLWYVRVSKDGATKENSFDVVGGWRGEWKTYLQVGQPIEP